MSKVEELKAALLVAQLEEKLVDAKATEAGPSRKLKEDVREARRVYRELRDAHRTDPLPGDAAVRPSEIGVTAAVENSEGA